MSFTRARVGGFSDGTRLTADEMNRINQYADAIDGTNGGTYALQEELVIDGPGEFVVHAKLVADEIEMSDAMYPGVTSRTIKRVVSLSSSVASDHGGSDDFSFSISNLSLVQNYVDVSAVNLPVCAIPLNNLIDLATLTTITVTIKPAAHGGNYPTDFPKIQLLKIDTSGGGIETIGSEFTDPTAGYDSVHSFSITGLTELIDQSNDPARYIVRFTGENNSNAVSGLQILNVVCSFTVTKVTPGG